MLIDDDNCCTHGLHNRLGRASSSNTNTDRRTFTCKPYSLLFFACDRLVDALSHNINNDETVNTTTISNNTISDTIQVAQETKENFKLFMAHKTRCACQILAISNLHKCLQD